MSRWNGCTWTTRLRDALDRGRHGDCLVSGAQRATLGPGSPRPSRALNYGAERARVVMLDDIQHYFRHRPPCFLDPPHVSRHRRGERVEFSTARHSPSLLLRLLRCHPQRRASPSHTTASESPTTASLSPSERQEPAGSSPNSLQTTKCVPRTSADHRRQDPHSEGARDGRDCAGVCGTNEVGIEAVQAGCMICRISCAV